METSRHAEPCGSNQAPLEQKVGVLLSRRAFCLVAACVAFLTLTADSCTPTDPPPIAGITIDTIAGLSTTIQKLNEMPRPVTTRVVFDKIPASDYTTAVNQLDPVTQIMGELVDSSDMNTYTTSAYVARANQYLTTLGGTVDIWEFGNEVNGNWTGSYANVAAKIDGAYGVFQNDVTALTLYYNPNNCDGPGELTPLEFTDQYVSARIKAGVDYVLLSYFETQCDNYRVPVSVVTALVDQLHVRYPNAKVGFGELGLPNKVTSATLANAESIMAYYYALDVPRDFYIGGYFWWYGKSDVLASGALLNQQFKDAIQTMP